MNFIIKKSFSVNLLRRNIMSCGFKVFVTQPIPAEALEILTRNEIETVVNEKIPLDRETFLENVRGVDGLYCTLDETIDKELLDRAGAKLKVIATCSVGFDHIDVQECARRGIKLGYTPGVKSATAEFAVALLLNTARRVHEGLAAAQGGEWTTWQLMWKCGKGLKNKTLGIFGFGNIGQAVAERLGGFELAKIIYSDMRPKKTSFEYVDFNELLKQSDFLICCAAATEQTQEIFSKDAFNRMKRDAIFVNISRGSLVNQDDLYDALVNQNILAAALDVTTPEPLPPSHKLFKLKNCLITPHMCSAEITTRVTMATVTSENIVSGLKQQPMPSEIPLFHKTIK